MSQCRRKWPFLLGFAASIAGGVAAALYMRSLRVSRVSDDKLRDAAQLIEHCRERLRELDRMKADHDRMLKQVS